MTKWDSFPRKGNQMEQIPGKKWIVILIVLILLLLLIIGCVVFRKGRDRQEQFSAPSPEALADMPEKLESGWEEGKAVQMIALADTREEAENIGELYDIKLMSFSNGVAVFETTADPYELMKMGEREGYPAISINHILSIDEEGQNEK